MSSRSVCPLAALLILASASVSVTAQDAPSPARLLRDINDSRFVTRIPSGFTRVGPVSYFVADTDGGDRIYRTFGTPSSTELFFDPNPQSPQRVRFLTAVGGRLFFFAAGRNEQLVLHVSDGTPAGTRRIEPAGNRAFGVAWAGAVGDRFVFFGEPTTSRNAEPWVSDGTAAGTRQLVDANPGQAGSQSMDGLTAVVPTAGGGARLWFALWVTRPAGTDTEIWSTDGTPGGTSLEGTLGGFRLLFGLTPLALDAVAFMALTPGMGNELFSVTRSQGATQLPAPPTLQRLIQGVEFDGRAFFSAVDAAAAVVTDGTVAGTVEVPLEGGSKSGPSAILTNTGGELVLGYPTAANDWRFASIARGATVAVEQGALPAQPAGLPQLTNSGALRIGDRLVVAVVPSPNVEEIHGVGVSGAALGQSELLYSGRVGSVLGAHFGRVLFVGKGTMGDEVWVTDGTTLGTSELIDLPGGVRDQGSDPQLFTPFGEQLAFLARTDRTPFEPYVTDGTEAGTYRLGQVPGRLNGGFIRAMVRVGTELWTLRPDPDVASDVRIEGWSGAPGQVRTVARLRGANQFGGWSRPTALGDRMLVFARRSDGGQGVHIVRGDGRIDRLLPSNGAPEHIVQLGEQALIVLPPVTAGFRSVWLTDGSITGTRQVTQVGSVFDPSRVARFHDRVWLSLAEGLYRLDDQGVELVDRNLRNLTLVAAGSQLFGVGDDRLVVTDGTLQGAVELLSGGQFLDIARLNPVAFGDRLLFVRDDRPWISDGTAAGTMQLADIELRDSEFWVTGNTRALFPGINPASGERAVFVTDGTPAGTRWLEDLPVIDGAPLLHEIGSAHGGEVVLLVDDPQVGIEPFVIDPRFGIETRGVPCTGQGYATPTLTVAGGDPRLGQSLRFDARAVGARLGWFVFGPVAPRPMLLPGSSCETHVDLFGAAISGDLPIGSSDVLQVPLRVPNTPALLGLRVAAQAFLATGRGPLQIDVTPTVILTVGR